LTSFSRLDAPPYQPSDVVTVDYVAGDDTVVQSVVFHFSDPTGQDHQVRADLDAATGPAQAPVDESWPSGAYSLTAIDLIDTSTNTISYLRDGTTSITPPTATGPTSHSFDLSTGDFSVASPPPPPPKPPLQGVVDRNGLPPAAWQGVVSAYV